MLNPLQPTALQHLQLAFCLIKLGGEILIVDRTEVAAVLSGQQVGSVNFYKRQAGEVLIKRFLEQLPITCDAKKTINNFWVDPATHVYTDIAFNPIAQPPSTLNYWVGPVIEPTQGDWSRIRTHLYEVICDGDIELFEYLLDYVAHMLQRPEEKPGVMVVLLGSQGTGKGLFFQILQRIWGRTSLLVSDIQQVVGNFNAALERNYVIMMDEALFSGDRKSQNRMKSFITEKSCTVEQKYQPSRTINSVHRFFASSNHEHFSHVEADDRRLLIVKVSKSRQGDRAYFSDLAAAIDDDTVIAAMVHDLMQLNLNHFDVRQRPLTQEHASQKIQSLQGFDRYWFEVLTNGRFGEDSPGTYGMDEHWKDDGFISTKSLCARYQYYDTQSQRFGATQTKAIAKSLEKLCPSAKPARKAERSGQSRGYKAPSLEVARREMEAYLKCTFDWGDDEVVEVTDERTSPLL